MGHGLTRKCKSCSAEKPIKSFRAHSRGFRWECRDCENSSVRSAKPWRSERKKKYQVIRRLARRGFSLTNDAKRRAQDRGLPFDLDWHDSQARIEAGVCEVTGLPFDLNTPKAWNAPSLDQIIPSGGYTRANTRVVLYAVNTMANVWGVEMILTVADAIRERRTVTKEAS